MNKSNFKLLLLIILFILLNQLLTILLGTNELLSQTLIKTYSKHDVDQYLQFQNKWQWISYPIIVVLLLLKISIITTILYIGLFFSNINIKFNTILNIAINAEFIFLLVPVFKILWFCFFQTKYNLEDIQYFYPLSALNITGYKNLEIWFIYPFQVLNLFEFFYIIYLGYEIGKLTNTNTDYGLKIVALSYIPNLLLWVTAVMFFTLNYS